MSRERGLRERDKGSEGVDRRWKIEEREERKYEKDRRERKEGVR
jgi:hypothetical protein